MANNIAATLYLLYMSVPEHTKLFGFDIFKEIESEIKDVKDVFMHSNSRDSYNAIVEMCIEALKRVEDRKRELLDNEFWD